MTDVEKQEKQYNNDLYQQASKEELERYYREKAVGDTDVGRFLKKIYDTN